MAKAPKDPGKLRTEPSEQSDEQRKARERFDDMSDRNEELCNTAEINDACLEIYDDVQKGFADQWERANAQMDYWDIYNCELSAKQFYSGNSKVFLPFVHDAVNARKTRFVNQIFPPSGKNVEVIASENKPQAMMALLEFYIRRTKMRSAVVPTLLKNGDVEGQYNVYMSWADHTQHVTWRVEKKPTHPDDPELELPDTDTYWDIEEEEIHSAFPDIEVLPDADVCVLPATARSTEEAIRMGGSVTVIRRWSKAKIRQLIRDEEIDEDRGEELLALFSDKSTTNTPNKDETIVDSAGIKKESGKMFALVYETWSMLKVQGERRMVRIRFGNEKIVLSCKRNPYWCDQCPLISAATNRTQGSFKGRSEIKNIETLQYAANDFINEALDSATYSVMPIVMTDPAKNPRTGSMQLSVAAIWETSPKDTQFASFPQLYDKGLEIVTSLKTQIFQTLGVNPAMIPQGTGSKGKAPNQAQVAQEQQVDILTTADVVTGAEGDILTPILRWFVYLDHQFRDRDLTLRQYGPVGKIMNMEVIEPVQMDRRWEVRWFGVEAARSAQQMQLQMAGLNMIRGIPPQQYEGFKLNMAPVLQVFMENLFGPRVAGEVFQDLKKQLTIEAGQENQMLLQGFPVAVHPMDDDQKHLQEHMQALQQEGNGDPTGVFRLHIQAHQHQLQLKAQMQQMQSAQQGQPGAPGGAGPGVAGTPRRGALPGPPRGGQQPPGVIHQDRMRDSSAMPRGRNGGM